jgi:hypothetical protein
MRKKLRLVDLNPNPYRDLGVYPFKRETINALKESIDETGFWDNIIAREQDGYIQIAYGHHRLKALHELYGEDSDFEVDIPVRDLSDAMMIKIMSQENMEEWRKDPAILDETVKAAKRFLEDHPEEAAKCGDLSKIKHDGSGKPSCLVGKTFIANFLKMPETRVACSLERLKLADEGMIDLKAVQSAKSNNAATTIAKLFVEVELPVKKQMAAVEAIKESKNYSESNIRRMAIDTKFGFKRNEDSSLKCPPLPEVKYKEYLGKKKITFDEFMYKTWRHASCLDDALGDLIRLKNELEGGDLILRESLYKGFNLCLDGIVQQINILRIPYSNPNPNPNETVNFSQYNIRLIGE